jgi:hypothetical protein
VPPLTAVPPDAAELAEPATGPPLALQAASSTLPVRAAVAAAARRANLVLIIVFPSV